MDSPKLVATRRVEIETHHVEPRCMARCVERDPETTQADIDLEATLGAFEPVNLRLASPSVYRQCEGLQGRALGIENRTRKGRGG